LALRGRFGAEAGVGFDIFSGAGASLINTRLGIPA
jgi:hypothetical protein